MKILIILLSVVAAFFLVKIAKSLVSKLLFLITVGLVAFLIYRYVFS